MEGLANDTEEWMSLTNTPHSERESFVRSSSHFWGAHVW
jgi:hypothetical protein